MKLTLKRLAILVGLIGLAELALAQELPKGYFRNPMDHDIGLSATFAEFRANHFHGGLDMRTGGAIGKAVYAAADGYVAKVSISPWGGGKILYIKHPNGYTSVYMHLDSYAGAIGREVLKEQYARQSYSIAKLFAPDELPVKKGQLVAYSGNTGSNTPDSSGKTGDSTSGSSGETGDSTSGSSGSWHPHLPCRRQTFRTGQGERTESIDAVLSWNLRYRRSRRLHSAQRSSPY